MLKPADDYFLGREEPVKSCLLSLRTIILKKDDRISEKWLYGMPFYYYDRKRFCYLWVHKNFHQPYIGIVDGNKISHPDLLKENRSRMKILLVDPAKNIPVRKINALLNETLKLYKVIP
jgi:hypothetical protein